MRGLCVYEMYGGLYSGLGKKEEDGQDSERRGRASKMSKTVRRRGLSLEGRRGSFDRTNGDKEGERRQEKKCRASRGNYELANVLAN